MIIQLSVIISLLYRFKWDNILCAINNQTWSNSKQVIRLNKHKKISNIKDVEYILVGVKDLADFQKANICNAINLITVLGRKVANKWFTPHSKERISREQLKIYLTNMGIPSDKADEFLLKRKGYLMR